MGKQKKEKQSENQGNKQGKKEEQSEQQQNTGAEHNKENRMSSFYTRFATTMLMLGGLVLFLCLGHTYCAVMCILLQIFCFKELKAIKRRRENDKNIPYFNVINWYFFVVTLVFICPLYLPNQTRLGITNPTLLWMFEYHRLISFCLFIGGFLLFTLSLENGTYKYQFKMLGWTLVVLLVVISQAAALIYNIYKGMYWFVFPACCIVSNDIFAYIFGFFFGKTPLIKLSPKKTWEGFIGGAACTFIWASIGAYFLSTIPALVCPQTRITFEPFAYPDCEVSSLYLPQKYTLPMEILGRD